MSKADETAPHNEWSGPTLDDAYRLAQSLDPDDRLKLVARLRASLPSEHRAAFFAIHLEDSRHSEDSPDPRNIQPESTVPRITPLVRRFLFDPTSTSGLYSAPRQFDLATIFVVTAAYSLLFGGLTAIDGTPLVKVVLGGLVTLVAAAQALYRHVANPRGVSVVVGASAGTIVSFVLWYVYPGEFIEPFLVVTIVYGLIGGAFAGYLAGVLVGGVFLVADIIRGRFEPRPQPDADETRVDGAD